MGQEYINSGELRDFVERHDLRDRNSIIQFNSIVTITTAKNEIINKKMVIMISFDNFNSCGDVNFLDGNLNPYLYPTVFKAKWQKFQHVGSEFLLITGEHTKNQDIGKYSVKITPLNRLRE